MSDELLESIAESIASIADSLATIKHMYQHIPQIHRIDARPGDVFVIQSERVLSPAQRKEILEQWDKLMPNAAVMVIDGGMTLGVIGEDDDDEDKPPDTYLDGTRANKAS